VEDGNLQLLQHLVNGLTLGGIYALIALGYTMVYGILKFINFAHGEILMVGTYAGMLVYDQMRGGSAVPGEMGAFLLSLLFAMLVSAMVGVTVERLAYRPLRRAERLAPLLSAIGVSIVLMNIVALAAGTQSKAYRYPFDNTPFELASASITPHQLLIMAVSFTLMLALRLFVDRTKLGKAMRATSLDLDTAKLMGIHADRIISLTFAIGSALAAVAGVLIALDYKVSPTMGSLAGLKAFIAAVVGGIGSISGAMLGGILLGLVETIGVAILGIPVGFKDTIAFALLIIILLVKPSGIMGKQQREKV